MVRPWKDPWNTTMLGRAVACRASLSAASTASLPELLKKTESRLAGQHLAQALGQGQQRAVHHGRVLPVDQLGHLLLGRRHHARVAVTGAGHPDAGGEVQVPPTRLVVQMDAFASLDQDGGCLLQQWRKVCHWASPW